jgi:hypothetical protein
VDDAGIEEIAEASHAALSTSPAKIAWVKRKLLNPDIRAALGDVFASAGLDVPYLLGKFKEHIDGIEHDVEIKDPKSKVTVEVVRVHDKPNYAALRDVAAMVLPAVPKEVRIDQRSVTMRLEAPERVGPPVMQARLLGSAKVVEQADE